MPMINIYTENTSVLELENRVEINKENAKNINTTLFELKAYPNWYYKNNKYLYFKECRNNIEILNHFICEKVAKYFSVETAHFLPAKTKYEEGLASINFRDCLYNFQIAKKDYFYSSNNPFITFKNLEINFENADELIKDIIRLIAFHIYTGLRDIHPYNVLFKEKSKRLILAPSFDYDYAFDCNDSLQNITYTSAICGFCIPSKDFEKILIEYPYFKEYLKLSLTVNMESIINEIIKEWNLFINDLYIDHYKKQDEIKKEFIRSLHL